MNLSLSEFTLGAVVAGFVAGVILLIAQFFGARVAAYLKAKSQRARQLLTLDYTSEFEAFVQIKILEAFILRLRLYFVILGIGALLMMPTIDQAATSFDVPVRVVRLVGGFIFGIAFGIFLALRQAQGLLLEKVLLQFQTAQAKSEAAALRAAISANAETGS